jgi:hypothetical protein
MNRIFMILASTGADISGVQNVPPLHFASNWICKFFQKVRKGLKPVLSSMSTTAAAHFNAAFVWHHQAIEHFEQVGLAGSVAADQAQAFTTLEFEEGLFDCPELVFTSRVKRILST